MDRNLALEFVRVTESAAIGAAKWVGRGDRKAADKAAVDEMRSRFNMIHFSGKVVIGEGEKDQAPKLYTGEKVGKGGKPVMDLAIDPLEATDSVAFGRNNAISVIAAGPSGSLLSAPDTYMEKIAVGKAAAKVISFNKNVKQNLAAVAKALNKKITEMTVVVLDRPRHEQLIADIRKAGARVNLITDGDVAAAVAACVPGSGVDVLMGIGGSTEAVLAAVPIKILGGEIICRFAPRNDGDQQEIMGYLKKIGIKNISKIFKSEDLARGEKLTFTATGVLSGPMLSGVEFGVNEIKTHSVVMRGSTKTIRYITTIHQH